MQSQKKKIDLLRKFWAKFGFSWATLENLVSFAKTSGNEQKMNYDRDLLLMFSRVFSFMMAWHWHLEWKLAVSTALFHESTANFLKEKKTWPEYSKNPTKRILPSQSLFEATDTCTFYAGLNQHPLLLRMLLFTPLSIPTYTLLQVFEQSTCELDWS